MQQQSQRKPVRNRARQEQLEVLLSYMEDHSEFARGHITNLGAAGQMKFNHMQGALTKQLNDLGPIQKTSMGWQKTWKTIKNSAKKKKAYYLFCMNKTGNDSPPETLNNFDERVTAIFGKHGLGLSVIPEIGILKYPGIEPEKDRNSKLQHYKHPDLSLHSAPNTERMLGNMCIDEVLKMSERNRDRDKRKKTMPSQKQMNQLLKFMEQHVLFARNAIADTKIHSTTWDELCALLNSHGVHRDSKSWQKDLMKRHLQTWQDLQRMAEQRKDLLNNGLRSMPLTDFDIRVLKIQKSNTVSMAQPRSRSRSPLGENSPVAGYSKWSPQKSNDQLQKRTPVKTELQRNPFIDLTNDRQNTEIDEPIHTIMNADQNRNRAKGPLKRPMVPATGIRSDNMINFMNNHFEQNNQRFGQLIDVLLAQNEIFERGFQLVERKLNVATPKNHDDVSKFEDDNVDDISTKEEEYESEVDAEEYENEEGGEEEYLDEDFLQVHGRL